MEFDQTTSRQLFMLKHFMKKYSKLAMILLACFILVFFGGYYLQKNKAIASAKASQIFQEMVFADLQQDPKTAVAKGEQLVKDYVSSPYAQLSGLLLAKIAINENNFTVAEERLRFVIAQKKSHKLAGCIATVRLAELLQQQDRLDEALALVAKDPEQAYLPLYAKMRGDLYVAKGDIEQAKKAYMLAAQSLPAGTQDPLLQMKLLDLGGE